MLKSTARLLFIASLSVVLFLGFPRILALGADSKIHQLAQQFLFELRRADALRQPFKPPQRSDAAAPQR